MSCNFATSAMRGWLLLSAVALAGCASTDNLSYTSDRDDAVQVSPPNYRSDILALLKTYLNDPRGYIPGNKMAFAGLTDPADLAEMLAYLRKIGDTPADLPK